MEETLEEKIPVAVKVPDDDQGTNSSLITSLFLCVNVNSHLVQHIKVHF